MNQTPDMLFISEEDKILANFKAGVPNSIYIDRKDISSKLQQSPWPIEIPVAFRSMTKRKEIHKCWQTGRDFYYVDNGYVGNLTKRKMYYRVVKNNIQHTKPRFDLPDDRWHELMSLAPYLRYSQGKRKFGNGGNGPILLVTPSEKPCQFYGVDKEKWQADTIQELQKYTTRKIIVRDKGLRPDRIADKSIMATCDRLRVHAVVTYQSVAALEAVAHGIPSFTMAPCAYDSLCNKDLSMIENPWYPDQDQVMKTLHWLAYCQYSVPELGDGTALRIIKEYGLC